MMPYKFYSQQPPVSLEEMDEMQELSAKDQAPIVRLLLSLWFAIISHSDLVCYFMVFLCQIKSATILSLPLPLMVFLWGTFTIPRPTKTFWVTMIAYTEVHKVYNCNPDWKSLHFVIMFHLLVPVSEK
jgi:hypothetical protein